MLFTAQALLGTRGLFFSSHRATISAFGQHFAKTKVLDPSFHQALLSAFSQRQLGDYAVDSGIRKEDVDELLMQSNAFLKAARDWIVKDKKR